MEPMNVEDAILVSQHYGDMSTDVMAVNAFGCRCSYRLYRIDYADIEVNDNKGERY